MEECGFQITDGVLQRVHCSGQTIPRSITVPAGVRVIGEEAFQFAPLQNPHGTLYCVYSVMLPEGLQEIRASAFQGNGGLDRVDLPESLRSIGDRAFRNCYALKSLVLPRGLTWVGKNAFQNCRELARITIQPGNSALDPGFLADLPEGVPGILEAPGFRVNRLPENVRHAAVLGMLERLDQGQPVEPEEEADAAAYLRERWPEFMEELRKNSRFLRHFLSWKVLPATALEVLLRRADPEDVETTAMLLDCLGRAPRHTPEQQLADMLREMETGALPEDVFDASWTFRRGEDGGLVITGYHGAEQDVVVPQARGQEPVTALGKQVFQGNSALTSVQIPGGVQAMGESVFAGCTSLRQVCLPSALRKIPDRAFVACSSLKELEIPESVAEIGAIAFGGCRELETIRLPEGLEAMGETPFAGCDSLVRVDTSGARFRMHGPFLLGGYGSVLMDALPARMKSAVKIPEGVREIAAGAFERRDDIVSVTMPDSVERIDERAFFCCPRLSRVTLGGGLREIGWKALSACQSLEEIVIPDSVERIGSMAFGGCFYLSSLTLGSGLREILTCAFECCRSLEYLTIPAGVEVIEDEAFLGCETLWEIVFQGIPRKIGSGVFEGVRARLQVPDGPEGRRLRKQLLRDCF